MMHEAIIASLLEYTGTQNQNDPAISNEDREEVRQLKEVMHLSKLEEEKKQGKLNLDFLKRKKNDTSLADKRPLIIPEPT